VKVLQYATYGGPEVLHIAERPRPEPGPTDVLVRVHAATVGVGDCKTRAGLLQGHFQVALPKIPGRYGSGTIAALGIENMAHRYQIGDAVVFATLHTDSGSAAEYVCVAADKIALKPANLSHVETAAMIQGGVTAYCCIIEAGDVARNEKILIHGAAGSVGSACVELACHLDLRITATCRAIDCDHVRSLGADHVIAFDRTDFSESVRDQGVVIDLVGGDVHRRSYDALRRDGRLIYLNAAPIENRGSLFGVHVRNAAVGNGRPLLAAVCQLAEQGVFAPRVGKMLPLDEGAKAHGLLESGAIKHGRVVLLLR
jgi:NADPH:quinone reductase-like Zn-dependent oxidoreductase